MIFANAYLIVPSLMGLMRYCDLSFTAAASSTSSPKHPSRNKIDKTDNLPLKTNKISDEDLPVSFHPSDNLNSSENIISPKQKNHPPIASPVTNVEGLKKQGDLERMKGKKYPLFA